MSNGKDEEIRNALNDKESSFDYRSYSTKDASDAAYALMEHAVLMMDEASIDYIQTQNEFIQGRWGGPDLIRGTREMVGSIILKNLQAWSKKSGFKSFKIQIGIWNGSNDDYAQANAFLESTFIAVRIWRNEDTFFVRGNRSFIP